MSKTLKPQQVKSPKAGLSGMSLGGFSRLSVARKVILTAAVMATLILVALVAISINQTSRDFYLSSTPTKFNFCVYFIFP